MECKDCIHEEVCENYLNEYGQSIKVPVGLTINGLTGIKKTKCPYEVDKSSLLELPCKIGTHLWKITYPYRQEPKVTEFVVKNFRTVGKRHKVQIEVQAVNVPGTNWMHYTAFYTSREEAVKELEKKYG